MGKNSQGKASPHDCFCICDWCNSCQLKVNCQWFFQENTKTPLKTNEYALKIDGLEDDSFPFQNGHYSGDIRSFSGKSHLFINLSNHLTCPTTSTPFTKNQGHDSLLRDSASSFVSSKSFHGKGYGSKWMGSFLLVRIQQTQEI